MEANKLIEAVRRNSLVAEVLEACSVLEIPNHFVSAGCIAQTVWNLAHHRDPTADIKDIDLVYFDPDLSEDREAEIRDQVRRRLTHIPLAFDVKNEARIHLWYQRAFGYEIPPYTSVEDAIASFPSTATAVGVRKDGKDYTTCVPFGLDDLFNLIVRPNKRQVTREIYERKVERWHSVWPRLTVIRWDDAL